jgi:hypothetical protein
MQLHEQPHALNAAWKAAELATDGTHRYLIVRMGLNHRLIGIDQRNMPTYGWCFKTYHHAYAALLLWEPDTQDEPLFWHKRAGEPRRAPRTSPSSGTSAPVSRAGHPGRAPLLAQARR